MKKIMLYLFIFLVLFIIYDVIVVRYYITIGEKISEEAIDNAYEQHPKNADLRILNIGDSSVVGVGALDPTKSVAGRLGAKYPNAVVVNNGVNGSKTKELIPRFEAIQDQKFDLIVIHTGGNDIVRLVNVEEAAKDLETVLDLSLIHI